VRRARVRVVEVALEQIALPDPAAPADHERILGARMIVRRNARARLEHHQDRGRIALDVDG